MRRRKFILNTGVAASGAGLLVGSGAFSRIEAQRGVTIEVVGDDDAYLRLVYGDAEIDDCFGTITLVTVQNQLKHAVNFEDIALEYDEDHLTIENLQFPERLEVGEEGTVTIDVSCTTPEEETSTVSFDIHVEEDLGGVLAQSRTIEVTCFCPDETIWAYGGDKSSDEVADDHPEDGPIRHLDGVNGQNWGWYFEYDLGSGEVSHPLYAGAGQNDLSNGVVVGQLLVDDDGDELTVSYDVNADDPEVDSVSLHEAHLYVGESTEDFVDETNGGAPGQFPHHDPSGVFSVDLTDDLDGVDPLIIAAHGVVAVSPPPE